MVMLAGKKNQIRSVGGQTQSGNRHNNQGTHLSSRRSSCQCVAQPPEGHQGDQMVSDQTGGCGDHNRQKILWSGKSISKKNTLGFLGVFYTKPFNPPLNQCFRCLRFGHVAIACKAESAMCRLCGESHETERCHQKKVANQEVTVKCANCRGPHPASSMRCPKRKEVARTIAVGPVALPRPKAVKHAPLKAADFPHLAKRTPVQQVEKPVKQKTSKPPSQTKAEQLDDFNNYICINHSVATRHESGLDLSILHNDLAAVSDWDIRPTLNSDHFATITTVHASVPDIPFPLPIYQSGK